MSSVTLLSQSFGQPDSPQLCSSFDEIKGKLDNLEYHSLSDVRLDFNQVFVNAKRYNAGGSAIFLDAKRLHVRLVFPPSSLAAFRRLIIPPRDFPLQKVLKDTYLNLTGESHASDAEEAPSSAPAVTSTHVGSTTAESSSTAPPNPSLPRRGPTLKPWLVRKLAETLNCTDAQ